MHYARRTKNGHEVLMVEGDTPLWYAVFRECLDGTQYAKGRYAVRKNPVISYADIYFYF